MGAKVRISVRELRVGMYVVDIDRPWEETPFLFQGFIINAKEDAEAVAEYCNYVVIDTALGVAPRKAKPVNKPAETKPSKKGGLFGLFRKSEEPVKKQSFEQEIKQAKKTYKKTSTLVRSFFDDIRLGIGFNAEAIKKQVGDCVDSILRNEDAMSWLARIQEKRTDISTHSLNTCVLCISFGKYLGLPRTELENLGLCALLHDVGLLKIDDRILFKKNALTSDEQALMRTHPELGRNILLAASDLYFGVTDVAYTHHERVNGTGYPRGLSANQISPFARIIGICDCYDSMVTDLPYQKSKTPFGALKILNQEKDKAYDGQLVKKFIDYIGIFPIGSIVELNSGEVGIVISLNRKQPNQPKILILINAQKQPCKERVMNLANDTNNKIVRILHPDDFEIDIEELKRRGLQLNLA